MAGVLGGLCDLLRGGILFRHSCRLGAFLLVFEVRVFDLVHVSLERVRNYLQQHSASPLQQESIEN